MRGRGQQIERQTYMLQVLEYDVLFDSTDRPLV